MINWQKKINALADNGLQANETIITAALLQPAGTTSSMANRQLFGLIGALISAKKDSNTKQDEQANQSKMAQAFPEGPVVVAVTNTDRVLLYEHSMLSGKPKKLLGTLPKTDIRIADSKKGMMATQLTLQFADGGKRFFEAAKAQKVKDFIAALN